MLAALKRGRAHGVIIHKIDRGARNLQDWANLGNLIDGGVEVREYAKINMQHGLVVFWHVPKVPDVPCRQLQGRTRACLRSPREQAIESVSNAYCERRFLNSRMISWRIRAPKFADFLDGGGKYRRFAGNVRTWR